jgi:hypothetical protein
VENLTSFSFDASTWDEVVDSLRNEKLKKLWEKEGGHGHLVVTISRKEGGLIQLVDCASPDRLVLDSEATKQKNERRMNGIRNLGVFRGLALVQDNVPSTSGYSDFVI